MTIPFTGEMMTCAMCGKQQRSDPRVESNWRAIMVDMVPFYICPLHFPPDGASEKEFQEAYEAAILHCCSLLGVTLQ